MKKYRLIFDGDKVVTEGMEGCSGPTCVSDTEKLLEPLKPKLEDRKLKSEYHKTKVAETIYA